MFFPNFLFLGHDGLFAGRILVDPYKLWPLGPNIARLFNLAEHINDYKKALKKAFRII